MKLKRNIILFLFAVCFHSCMTPDYAYIRNLTNGIAIIDVILLDKNDIKRLPNQVRIADRIVAFKGGYRSSLSVNTQNVVWLDTSHFQFRINPRSTADLTDMIGKVTNSSPENQRMRLTITSNGKTDTLLTGNGWKDYNYYTFRYKNIWFGRPVLYYDIK